MADLERLVAIEDIKQLKARYFRCMDTKDWTGLAAVFAPDAEADFSGEAHDGSNPDAARIRGGAAIAAFMRQSVESIVTVHHGHMPEIEMTSAASARGIWAMEDVLRWPAGGPISTLHGFGHYHETYERIDGRWYIRSLRLSRLRVDIG